MASFLTTLMDNFASFRIFCDLKIFLALWIYHPLFSGHQISDEKSADSFWDSLVCDESHLNLFEGSLSFESLILMCLLWISWSSLSFSDVYIYVFHQIWGFFSHYFFKYSFCHFLFFWDPTIHILVTWWCCSFLNSVHFSLIFSLPTSQT